jgi:ribosomal protein L7Ae-like RNA K-turn-binding protein
VILLLYTRLGSHLSMAQKAGAAISGATPLRKALTQRQVRYMVLAEDMAASRAEIYHSWCRQQSIPWLTLFSKDKLGQLLGKPERSAVGLTDRRFGELLHATANTLLRFQADSGCAEAPCNRAISSL